MKLRRQLFLVSMLTLALPWAGCEYIREMEKTLRQGQTAALLATARAVAARMASDPEVQQSIQQAAPANHGTSPPLYAHSLDNAPVVDGYDDDWRGLSLASTALAEPKASAPSIRLVAGQAKGELYLFAKVRDATPRYYTPQRPLEETDHLHLLLQPENAATKGYRIYTAAPGKVTVVTDDGQREHRINGVWLEWQDGYQVELRLPRTWAQQQFGLSVVDASQAGSRTLGNVETGSPVISRQGQLDAALAIFVEGATSGTMLRLVAAPDWVIAEAGLQGAEPNTQPGANSTLLARIYRLALGKQSFPSLSTPYHDGKLSGSEVALALNGDAGVKWYQQGGQQVVRAAAPVTFPGSAGAAVVAEQTTDTLRAMTGSAFSRLVNYSLAAFGVTGLGLLAYASWLSWRIRRLSRAADRAVDANGRISQDFPRSRGRDELGELSRRYGDLLERLRQYNIYLETLASKLSHELRTPLAVVSSSLDNLEDAPLTPEARTYSARAREGADRLSKILTAMSAASRMEQSIQAADLEVVDLGEVLRDLTEAYADAYPRVNWRFSADEGDHHLKCAPELLVQMLDKLADNAADFCPQGDAVELRLEHQPRQLVIRVSNPGPALPRQMRGQLFDSLVSVREAGSAGEHLGLGLYIVRLIVEFHGGSVEADNGPGNSGAIFTVRFPSEP